MRSLPGRGQSHSACWDAPLVKRSASSTLEGSAAKLHDAATVVDREDDPAPGKRVWRWEKHLTRRSRLDDDPICSKIDLGSMASRRRHWRLWALSRYAKTTRRATFLAEMEAVVPWVEFCRLIDPFYPKAGNGQRPIGLERMLRIYFQQQWFDLFDPGAEEALYDSITMRRFVGVDLGREPVPDETTIDYFRHLLERHDLGNRVFEAVHEHLERRGIKLARGSIVDATIISAPSSTKNAAGERDPDMCQTLEGNQWYFGIAAARPAKSIRFLGVCRASFNSILN
jgi:Transposase domain (DUF772)